MGIKQMIYVRGHAGELSSSHRLCRWRCAVKAYSNENSANGIDRMKGKQLSREERDLAANVKSLLQRERVRLDRDISETSKVAVSPSPPDSPSASQTPTSPFARKASFRSAKVDDPFMGSNSRSTSVPFKKIKKSVKESVEIDEATKQTAEDEKVTWIWERVDAEQLLVAFSISLIFMLMCFTFALVFKSGAVHFNE